MKKIFLIILLLQVSILSFAYDFSVDGIYYNVISREDKTCEITYRVSGSTPYHGHFVIPSTVTYQEMEFTITQVGDRAFQQCSSLLSVEIPETVTKIGGYAFAYCSSLSAVYIPNSVTYIGSASFVRCTSLKQITFPSGLEEIGYEAFDHCTSLEIVNIPSLVTKIGHKAFYSCTKLKYVNLPAFLPTEDPFFSPMANAVFAGCINISQLTCYSKKVPSLYGNTLDDISRTECVIRVPAESIELYKNANFWKDFWNFVSIEDTSGYYPVATSINLPQEELNLDINTSFILYATIEPFDALDTHITWSSSDSNVATISKVGLINAVSLGSTIITATDVYGNEAQCVVTVNPILPNNISFNKKNITLFVGDSETIIATVTPTNASDSSLTWSSSNDNIVTVIDGVITAHAVGEADISATTVNGKSDICHVTVNPILANSISLNETEIWLYVNESITLVASILPENTTDKTVFWQSYKPEVVTVDENGFVLAMKPGTALISATSANGISAYCNVHVKEILASAISLNVTELELEIGESATLIASILPDNATNKTVAWRSSDEEIATISDEGIVTAISEGEAVITAITTDGSYLSATCRLNSKSGIDGICTDSNISIKTLNNEIVIFGAKEDEYARVLDIRGSLVFCGLDRTISLPVNNIYFVVISNNIFKVIL